MSEATQKRKSPFGLTVLGFMKPYHQEVTAARDRQVSEGRKLRLHVFKYKHEVERASWNWKETINTQIPFLLQNHILNLHTAQPTRDQMCKHLSLCGSFLSKQTEKEVRIQILHSPLCTKNHA